MFGYALVGSNDLDKAKAFYDALLGSAGMPTMFEHSSGGRVYGNGMGQPFFAVVAPFDGKPATVGNGSMLSLSLDSPSAVDAFHALALSLGGADEGQPGLRGAAEYGFYAAYFRDLDGNKFCAFHTGG
ncbi:glyoxalase [Sphingomonas sp. KC8]|nr:VOC family protein [Sphingomonas sp. KC8]ARS27544.1 glyoxalase [Sphingomonas sp. KC8]